MEENRPRRRWFTQVIETEPLGSKAIQNKTGKRNLWGTKLIHGSSQNPILPPLPTTRDSTFNHVRVILIHGLCKLRLSLSAVFQLNLCFPWILLTTWHQWVFLIKISPTLITQLVHASHSFFENSQTSFKPKFPKRSHNCISPEIFACPQPEDSAVLFYFVFFLLFDGDGIAKFYNSVGWRGPRIFGTQLNNISLWRHLLIWLFVIINLAYSFGLDPLAWVCFVLGLFIDMFILFFDVSSGIHLKRFKNLTSIKVVEQWRKPCLWTHLFAFDLIPCSGTLLFLCGY